MLSCKQIVELASKNVDTELVWHEKLGFKMHLMMCKHCNHYAQQLKFIQQAVSGLMNEQEPTLEPTNKSNQLSAAARERISQALSKLKA